MKNSKYNEIDLSNIKTSSIGDLSRKVERDEFARPLAEDADIPALFESFPNILAAKDLHKFAAIIANSKRANGSLILMFGGHVIKTGLAPLLIDWIQKRIISCMSTHGAGIIHDTEIALFGRTSEDVAEGLADGSFGMVKETAEFINRAISNPKNRDLGYGEAVAYALIEAKAPFADMSLLCAAYDSDVPMTVHVGLGTDIIHQHPSADGSAIGNSSMRDFRILADSVAQLNENSVVLNLGSAVLMPEVFLKALSVARNLGNQAHRFTTANFDMLTHYRPMQNILKRPTMTGGKYYNFIGHHEIMIPLLHAMVGQEFK